MSYAVKEIYYTLQGGGSKNAADRPERGRPCGPRGLDVPALTHVACLTHIRSFPWLMQMLGRVMRYDRAAGRWDRQHAFAFVPDDPLMQQAIEYVRREQA